MASGLDGSAGAATILAREPDAGTWNPLGSPALERLERASSPGDSKGSGLGGIGRAAAPAPRRASPKALGKTSPNLAARWPSAPLLFSRGSCVGQRLFSPAEPRVGRR